MCRVLLRIQGWHCFKRCFTSLERQFLRLVKNEQDNWNGEEQGVNVVFDFSNKNGKTILLKTLLNTKNPLFSGFSIILNLLKSQSASGQLCRFLMFADHLCKLLEEIMAILWPRRSLRVLLHRKDRLADKPDTTI